MPGDGIPIQQRYTRALPGALNVDAPATNDDTTQSVQQLNVDNDIEDMFTSPPPAAGVDYEIRLIKNNVPTGRIFYSNAMNTGSAGRVKIGPVGLSPGQILYQVRQVLGALAAMSFVVKYSNGF